MSYSWIMVMNPPHPPRHRHPYLNHFHFHHNPCIYPKEKHLPYRHSSARMASVNVNDAVDAVVMNITTTTLHRVAIPSVSSSQSPPPLSPRILRDLWKWKDGTLGNGHDYFIPKSRAIRDLIHVFLLQHQEDEEEKEASQLHTTHEIVECCVLSNCVRFDILLVIQSMSLFPVPAESSSIAAAAARTRRLGMIQQANEFSKHVVTQVLLSQLQASSAFSSLYKNKINTQSLFLESLSSFFDLPGRVIHTNIPFLNRTTSNTPTNTSIPTTYCFNHTTTHNDNFNKDYVDLYTHLIHTSNSTEIIEYFCHVAAGINIRIHHSPNTAHVVLFRPYSSRDAHIMLQLKRTSDIISTFSSSSSSSSSTISVISRTNRKNTTRKTTFPRIKILLDTALQVGKAVRNPTRIPSILQLKEYTSSKSIPSMKILKPILQDIHQQVIQPMISTCIQRWSMYESSTFITTFQQHVYDFIDCYLKEKNYHQDEEEEEGDRPKNKKKNNKPTPLKMKKNKMRNHSNIPLSLMRRIQPILHTSYMTLRQQEQDQQQQQQQQQPLVTHTIIPMTSKDQHMDSPPHEYLLEKTLMEIQKQMDEWWWWWYREEKEKNQENTKESIHESLV